MEEGLGLLRVLIQATGLPEEAVERELAKILKARGLSPEKLSLEDVRDVLSSYLQDVLCEAKDDVNGRFENSESR